MVAPKKCCAFFQQTISLDPLKRNETDFTKMFLEFLTIKIKLQFLYTLLNVLCKLAQFYYNQKRLFEQFN